MWFAVSLLFGAYEIHIMKIGFRHGRFSQMSPNKDKTGNDRQRRRREREKVWLKEHGFESWEALHTALMNGETSLTKPAPDAWESAPLNLLSTVEVDSDLGKVPTPTQRE